jgi:RNA polymerase sigma factor (sigma-70 family)
MNPRLVPTSRLARSVLRTQSDERLVELVRTGSDPAFEAIVARHRRSLVRHCARLVGDADSEEAVQDALLRAHAALARGQRVGNVRAWLHVIAHNTALNILRVRAGRRELPSPPDEAIEPHDRTSEQREQLRDLLAALQSLPQRQRDAIVLRELAGLSYWQIADRHGTTDGAVRQLLFRARDAIRARLGALTGFEPLLRYTLGGGGSGQVGAAARIGALSGGCALTVKVCGAALLPAAVVGTVGTTRSGPPRHPPASSTRATRQARRAAVPRATTTSTAVTPTVAAAEHMATAPSHVRGGLAHPPSNAAVAPQTQAVATAAASMPTPQRRQVALPPARAPPPQARAQPGGPGDLGGPGGPGDPGDPGGSGGSGDAGGASEAVPQRPTTVPRQQFSEERSTPP